MEEKFQVARDRIGSQLETVIDKIPSLALVIGTDPLDEKAILFFEWFSFSKTHGCGFFQALQALFNRVSFDERDHNRLNVTSITRKLVVNHFEGSIFGQLN